MNILQLPGKFIRADKIMALEVLFWLTVARILIFHCDFKRIKPLLGSHMQKPSSIENKDLTLVKKLRQYINKTGKVLPWHCTCFINAVSAKRVLKRRGYNSTIYFGVHKDENSEVTAHAWLECGETTVTGGAEKERFKVVSFYS